MTYVTHGICLLCGIVDIVLLYCLLKEHLPTIIRIQRYPMDDLEEHPGCLNDSFFFDMHHKKISTSSVSHVQNSFVNDSADDGLVEFFNHDAYMKVDLDALEQQASKALEMNHEMCENMTSSWSFNKSRDTGIPLCSCAPETLGVYDLSLFLTCINNTKCIFNSNS